MKTKKNKVEIRTRPPLRKFGIQATVGSNSLDLKVRIYLHHKSYLIIHTSDPDQGIDNEWWPRNMETGGSRFGCVVGQTAQNLGITEAAIQALGGVRTNNDSMGDVDWFMTNRGYAFSWIGAPSHIMDLNKVVGARNFSIHLDQCVIIPHDPLRVQSVLDEDQIQEIMHR